MAGNGIGLGWDWEEGRGVRGEVRRMKDEVEMEEMGGGRVVGLGAFFGGVIEVAQAFSGGR